MCLLQLQEETIIMIEIINVLLTDTRGNKLDKATSGVAAWTVDLHSRYPLI